MTEISVTPPVTSIPPTPQEELVEAKPLVDPDFTDLKSHIANKALEPRWVNRVAGNGERFHQMEAVGFRPVLLSDLKKDATGAPTLSKHLIRDGKVIYGDLIAMVIDAKKYKGALLHNEQKAIRRLSRDNDLQVGRDKMRDALSEVQGSAANKAKISLYKPSI